MADSNVEVLGQYDFEADTSNTFRVNGTFQCSDGNYRSGITVHLYADACVNNDLAGTPVLLGSDTTDSNGAYSIDGDLSNAMTGEVFIYAAVGGDVSSSFWGYITAVEQFDSIVLSSDKSILSYADNDSATLTAQLQLNGSNIGISGVSVSFEIYDSEDNLLDTLTGTTNSNGQCSVSFFSQGTGYINIKAVVSNVYSNNIQIEDNIKYDDATTNKLADYTWDTSLLTASYDDANQCYIIQNSGRTAWPVFCGYFSLTGNVVAECDMLISSDYSPNKQPRLCLINNNNGANEYYSVKISPTYSEAGINVYTTTDVSYNETRTITLNEWYNLKIQYENGLLTVYIYLNDTLVLTKSMSFTLSDLKGIAVMPTSNTTKVLFKNLKVKQL